MSEPQPEPDPSRSDLATYREAFAKEWAIPPDVRTKSIKRIVRILETDVTTGLPLAGNRASIAAFRALVAAARANSHREAVELDIAEFAYRQECDRLRNVITTDQVDRIPAEAADRMLRALLNESDPDGT